MCSMYRLQSWDELAKCIPEVREQVFDTLKYMLGEVGTCGDIQ